MDKGVVPCPVEFRPKDLHKTQESKDRSYRTATLRRVEPWLVSRRRPGYPTDTKDGQLKLRVLTGGRMRQCWAQLAAAA
jgi:hypothetical protein